jgi:ribosomal protein S18 acetylase RimI-like enzyme
MRVDLTEWRHLSGIEEGWGNFDTSPSRRVRVSPLGRHACVRPIYDGAEDTSYPDYKDYYEVIDEAEMLFQKAGIRLASYEAPLFACFDPEGETVGAVFAGLYPAGHAGRTARFSVAVSPRARRQRVASQLVGAMIRHYQRSGSVDRLEAWVVNPNMAALLEKFGFEPVDGEWSQDSPHMELWL